VHQVFGKRRPKQDVIVIKMRIQSQTIGRLLDVTGRTLKVSLQAGLTGPLQQDPNTMERCHGTVLLCELFSHSSML